MPKPIRNFYNRIMKDSLYRNSIFLMINTGVMAVFGFVFWIIVSRLYTPDQVGLATTLISVMGLISGFSLLGLNAGLVRFLPTSERKNDKINTAFTLTAIVTIIVTAIFLMGLEGFSPKLLFIKQNAIYSFAFIIFMIFATLNSLIESVYLAYRRTGYTLLKNTIFSALKVIFPVMLVSLGVYGIFGSWMIGLIIGFLVSFLLLIKKFSYNPKIVFYDSIINKMGKYSFGNYVAGFIGGLSTMLLPLMITNIHLTQTTAYYYIAMSIASVLFIIPQATTNSLFAEGSNNQKTMQMQIKKSIKIISWLMIPAMIVLIFVGKYILLFFGNNYASNGTFFLEILAISGIFVSINSVYGAILRVKKKISMMIIMAIISAGLILAMSYFAITNGFGLNGIGYSYLIGQAITSLAYLILVRK